MRRALLLGGAAASALLAVAWARGGAGARPGPAPRTAPVQRTVPRPAPLDDRLPVPAARNLFEYGSGSLSTPPAPAIEPGRLLAAAVPSPAPVVRWIGVVHRGREVLAAVSIEGEVATLAPGESASGYTLVSVDEDQGARFRGPHGEALTAAPVP